MSVALSVEKQMQRLHNSYLGVNVPVAALPLIDNPKESLLHLLTTPFGRDMLLTADDELDHRPSTALKVIRFLSQTQGLIQQTEPDAEGNWSEEEPGRILHEYRLPDDPIAKQLSQTRQWGWPYYGAIDSTPLFINLISRYSQQHGLAWLRETIPDKNGETKTLADSLAAAVGWITRRMDSNPEGLIESKSPNPKGAQYQGWRDSQDAYFDVSGNLATGPVSQIEVQTQAHDALGNAAALYFSLAELSQREIASFFSGSVPNAKKLMAQFAEELKIRAQQVKATLLNKFYLPNRGYFAMGLERDGEGNLKALEDKSSVIGWLLNSGLFNSTDQEPVKAIIKALFEPDLQTRWGIRTLSETSVRYSPYSYHNGSVWLIDNNQIAKGLSRHEYHGLARELYRRNIQIAKLTGLLPEFVVGKNTLLPEINRSNGTVKTAGGFDTEHRISQQVQTFTASAVLYAKRMATAYYRGIIPQQATDPEKAGLEKIINLIIPASGA